MRGSGVSISAIASDLSAYLERWGLSGGRRAMSMGSSTRVKPHCLTMCYPLARVTEKEKETERERETERDRERERKIIIIKKKKNGSRNKDHKTKTYI